MTTAEEFNSPAATPPGIKPPDVATRHHGTTWRQADHRPAISIRRRQPAVAATCWRKTTSWYFLKDVEVDRTKKSAAVIALGDSITDGTGSTDETNRRWPDVLAPRLAAEKKTAALSVVNEGIGGNRILHEGTGPSALDRFHREVLSQPGAHYVFNARGH